ncbi:hypothetical protein KUV62_21235 [Salipiger bermudensis]|uniref:hypothetical protein n=1 Tax=Salipiger bermudensis TaxID=344736 RepID=UPI001C992D8C|nr:hypothetical protein [Salipiger bermudensis]MBY6006462.1 hypothetical protein [Salipiger bermudensis]
MLAFLLSAAPASAEREAGVVASTLEDRFSPALLKPLEVINPPPLYLEQRETLPFLDERRALMSRIREAEAGSPDAARALTDLAEFYFAHGMASEGLSVLDAVQGPGLPLAHELRASAFELALGLTDPLRRPLTDRAQALLEPGHGEWADQPLFLALSHMRDGRCDEAGALLDEAVTRLARFSKPVQERVLPGLLECAIETQQWRLARDLAAAFDAYPELKGGSAYRFLLGRVAEAGDAPLAAFDSYVQAQGGNDFWAHRARRALVDLGLAHEALAPEEAVTLLAQEAEIWRGGEEGASTLRDLASLQLIAKDPASAIETYGRIIVRHPESAEANEARQKARTLIDELYRAGAAREVSLGRFMAHHERIAPFFRFNLAFADASELLADTFLKAGATTIAAREYATIHDYLVAGQDLGITETGPGHLERLKIKEAEALAAGGQWETLGALLAQPLEIDDAGLRRRYDLVSADYLEETGQASELLSGSTDEAPEQVLRLRAQARFDEADWSAAVAAYGLLHERLGSEMPLPDSIRYLLAAHRDGDLAQTAELARAFPALTELPAWADISRSLTQAAPELLPLREETARARIESAGDVLETLPGAEQLN